MRRLDIFMALGLLRAGGLTDKDVALKPVGMGGPAAISQGQLARHLFLRRKKQSTPRGETAPDMSGPSRRHFRWKKEVVLLVIVYQRLDLLGVFRQDHSGDRL